MQQWEYIRVKIDKVHYEGVLELISIPVDEGKEEYEGVPMAWYFNWLGGKGWELVCGPSEPTGGVFTFKRPKVRKGGKGGPRSGSAGKAFWELDEREKELGVWATLFDSPKRKKPRQVCSGSGTKEKRRQ